ncbi:protein FAM91A1-like [Branchiostoma lanceolatum]|uniref:protein FAM91A1-like n=1 Tax=Branchiostoma lanceolatum TaxID=7740 RepID=UPI00345469C4
MNADVEFHIRHNYTWAKLPASVKQVMGNSQKEYEKAVVTFSIRNQLRYKGNLVRHVRKDEKRYYEDLLQYSREHLLLYPYHLSDIMVKGLRITPFSYYLRIMEDTMANEKSYDSLPNFTAADCLRLMGIGRNQYIDLMNQCRSSKKFFRRKPIRDLLPTTPVDISLEPWWISQAGYITEDDIKMCKVSEKNLVDIIIDSGPQEIGMLDYKYIQSLYHKGLVYLEVPINDDDCIIVPPLEGFVMNRVQGDYLETLLYKIFVSIDEHTTVNELANVLQIDLQLVKNAVSMFCRLGFAKKKGSDPDADSLHPSWRNRPISTQKKLSQEEQLLIDWGSTVQPASSELSADEVDTVSLEEHSSADTASIGSATTSGYTKRIGFLFDSTLTAFLMMGNLSPGLKSHAVTMFEVGKLCDESLDSFLAELEKIETVGEGEAQRYFEHANTLRKTLVFLRHNKDLSPDPDFQNTGLGVDLVRCESLLGLDPGTCSRVLNKNYTLLISMAPLSNEIRPVSSCTPQHIGPAIPEVNSIWFKLFLYHVTGCGPPTLLLVRGTRLRRLPSVFQEYDRLLITTWGHDPGVVATSNVLLTLNDALTHSAVLIQAHGLYTDGETEYVPFPLEDAGDKVLFSRNMMQAHYAVQKLASQLDLSHTCGYVTMLKTGKTHRTSSQVIAMPTQQGQNATDGQKEGSSSGENNGDSFVMVNRDTLSLDVSSPLRNNGRKEGQTEETEAEWVMLDMFYGIPLFNGELNTRVCERMAAQGLCRLESLGELLHSSRKLVLQLLDFISENQDLPIVPEQGGDGLAPVGGTTSQDHGVPLPTRNLLFHEGKLAMWDGK